MSLIVYGVIFFCVHKPLTVGIIADYFQHKREAALRSDSPRIFILAGSNGRFSHRCEAIEQILLRPCVNLSVARGIGLRYVLSQYEDIFKSGDLIYMPWEYAEYALTEEEMQIGPQNALMWRQHRGAVWHDGIKTFVRSYFAFDLSYLTQGLAEMGLNTRGIKQRYGLHTLTRNGDESGHSANRGGEYRTALLGIKWAPPNHELLLRPSFSKLLLGEFILRLRDRGVRVVGGLPTTFADKSVDRRLVEGLRDFYAANGGTFATLLNKSQYERSCFYDTDAHLNEECQILHSRKLAELLRPFL